MRKLRRRALNDYGKPIKEPDVRPLDKREHPLNIRKGLIKVNKTPVNINWMHKQGILPL